MNRPNKGTHQTSDIVTPIPVDAPPPANILSMHF